MVQLQVLFARWRAKDLSLVEINESLASVAGFASCKAALPRFVLHLEISVRLFGPSSLSRSHLAGVASCVVGLDMSKI